jgi:hypothetical protein
MNGKKTVRQVQNCHSVSSRKTLNLLKQPDSSLFFAQGLISTLGRVNDTCMFCTSVVKVTVPPLLTQLYRRSALCWTGIHSCKQAGQNCCYGHDLLYYNRPVQKCNLSDPRRALVYGRFLGIIFILSFCHREFFSFK